MNGRTLKIAWLNLIPGKATKGSPNVASRLYWAGLPNKDENDILALKGMELRLTWRGHDAPPTEEHIVSQILFEEFLGIRTDPKNSQITWHDYLISIIQSTDPESAYGKLISRQRRTGGQRDDRLGISIQNFRARIYVGPLLENLKPHLGKVLKGKFPARTLRDLVRISAPDTKLDEQGYLPEDKLLPSAKLRLLSKSGSLINQLSDLAIDRLYELQGMLAEWHFNLSANKKDRPKKAKTFKLLLDSKVNRKKEVLLLISDSERAIEQTEAELNQQRDNLSNPSSNTDFQTDANVLRIRENIAEVQADLAITQAEFQQSVTEIALVLRKLGVGQKLDEAKNRKQLIEDKLKELNEKIAQLEAELQLYMISKTEEIRQSCELRLAEITQKEEKLAIMKAKLETLVDESKQLDQEIELAHMQVDMYSEKI